MNTSATWVSQEADSERLDLVQWDSQESDREGSDSGQLGLQNLDLQEPGNEESEPSNPPRPQAELRRGTRPRKPTDRFTFP